MFEKIKELFSTAHIETKAIKKSNNEVALEVLLGKWGSGKTRKKKLTKAGYNYDAIQKIVNDRMTKKSIDTVAKEVIDGKWGSGETRKKCLEVAGYNYNTVQNRVNEMLADTPQDKMCAWAKMIADSKKFKYVRWSSKNKKTQTCPICAKRVTMKTVYDASKKVFTLQSFKINDNEAIGGNCIWGAWHTWHHGAGTKTNCDCGVISNEIAEKILKAKTDADANSIAKKYVGTNDLKVIRNGGKAIPVSSLKKGDVVLYFKGKEYFHTVLYVGDGKMFESNTTKPNITYGKKMPTSYGKVAIRYTGK